jgi:hypothetical protein
MSTVVSDYNCKVFLKNIKIQQEIIIDNNTQIMMSEQGFTCYDPATYMVNYLETVSGKKVKFDVSSLSKRYAQDMPVCVIKMWNVKASNIKAASQIALEKSQPILKFLCYNQGQFPETFGVAVTRKGEGQYISVIPAKYCGWKIHLMGNLNVQAKYITDRIQKDGKLNLYLTLFSDSISEDNIDFKIVKLWTILEIMGASYKERGKEQKVRALLRDYQININRYGDYDLIKLSYMHRNAVVHEGTSDPHSVSPNYVEFLRVSTTNISGIINELQELTNFVIDLYMRRTAKS